MNGVLFMAVFRPFQAFRPLPEYAARVAELPYDVMNTQEARAISSGNPYSFLHVDKAEIDLPEGTGLYDDKVYLTAARNLEKLETQGVCALDKTPGIYIYRQTMNSRSQTGLVGCVSIDDYLNNIIKKHEFTRADKEADRIRHVDSCNANTGPIFLAYRPDAALAKALSDFTRSNKPVYDFVHRDGVAHTVWAVGNDTLEGVVIARLAEKTLYIADGHHRAASAVKVGLMRREQNPGYTGQEEFNFFLAVLFSSDELEIMDYNRLITDLNGLDAGAFISLVSEKFEIGAVEAGEHFKPSRRHTFGMFFQGEWKKLTAKEGTFNAGDPVDSLDVTILQNNLIEPVLGISDPRTDHRIDFVGGIRGIGELERRVSQGMAVAFSMFPPSLDELMAIADAGKVMPPKSTWFEPKLLSGLFVHRLG